MLIIGAGWRRYNSTRLPELALEQLLALAASQGEQLEVVHGDAPGWDTIAAAWAARRKFGGHNVAHRPYPADWRIWGKRAGNLRNAHMWATNWHHTDLCLAFPGPPGQSPGTANCIEFARIYERPLWLVPFDAAELPPMPALQPRSAWQSGI